jgi:hypothetical protein
MQYQLKMLKSKLNILKSIKSLIKIGYDSFNNILVIYIYIIIKLKNICLLKTKHCLKILTSCKKYT